MAQASADVVVLGLGPAGRSLVSRLAARGADVIGVDLAPERSWTPTYALWGHEVPDWLTREAIASSSEVRAFALTEHRLAEPYLVLDTVGLQRALTVDGARIVEGRVASVDGAHTVHLVDGRSLTAGTVVDARGSRPAASKAQQTAVGVLLPAERTRAIEGSWLMDWRTDNGTTADAPPSFLYVVPVTDGRVLLEETCLVGRPALGYAELERRLRVRLAARGIRLRGDEPREHVRFAVEPPDSGPGGVSAGRAAGQGPLAIGACGGIMHPATGYSVGPSLQLADDLAATLASAPQRAAELIAGRRMRQVAFLRRAGLATLLQLAPTEVPAFFESFFRLPPALRRAYLTDRDQPVATSAAMARMALSLPPRLTGLAVRSTVRSAVDDFTRRRRGAGA